MTIQVINNTRVPQIKKSIHKYFVLAINRDSDLRVRADKVFWSVSWNPYSAQQYYCSSVPQLRGARQSSGRYTQSPWYASPVKFGREDEVAVYEARRRHQDNGVDHGVNCGPLRPAGGKPGVELFRSCRPRHRQVHPARGTQKTEHVQRLANAASSTYVLRSASSCWPKQSGPMRFLN